MFDYYFYRNSEATSIKNRHYRRDCIGEAPHCVPHDKVYLVNRKGWTRESGNTVAATGKILLSLLDTTDL